MDRRLVDILEERLRDQGAKLLSWQEIGPDGAILEQPFSGVVCIRLYVWDGIFVVIEKNEEMGEVTDFICPADAERFQARKQFYGGVI